MGKKNKKKSDKNSKSATTTTSNGKEGLIMVDPSRVRFQHARIRPFFSGCGRSVVETLEGIRQGKLSPSDLPPIQVLVGPTTATTTDVADDGPWYFSLNNRRLWVLKRCREEGLLGPNNRIAVRVRKPKSEQEMKRYTIENCALEAKIMPEKSKNATINNESNQSSSTTNVDSNAAATATATATAGRDVDIFNREKVDDRLEIITKSDVQIGTSQGIDDDDESYSSDEDDDGINTRSANRFSALLL